MRVHVRWARRSPRTKAPKIPGLYKPPFRDVQEVNIAVAADIVERLAALEHEQWAQWAASVLRTEPGISEERKRRWARLIAVHYNDLTEAEKELDRQWARKAIAALAE